MACVLIGAEGWRLHGRDVKMTECTYSTLQAHHFAVDLHSPQRQVHTDIVICAMMAAKCHKLSCTFCTICTPNSLRTRLACRRRRPDIDPPLCRYLRSSIPSSSFTDVSVVYIALPSISTFSFRLVAVGAAIVAVVEAEASSICSICLGSSSSSSSLPGYHR